MSKSESLLRLTIPAVLALASATLTGTAQAADAGCERIVSVHLVMVKDPSPTAKSEQSS